MAITIRKAERAQAKLRIGLSGPSGSGKTYSGLLMARGMATTWEKIVLIDSENGSGELYSDLGEYNVITMTAPFSPEKYIEAIQATEDAGMEVIVIDSTSHEWDGKGGCLEINERLASAKYKGNTWAAWSETTPRHQKFIEAITQSGCHVVTTQRSKTDTIQTEDKKIKKVGLKDIQREGFEYELTANFNIDREGHLTIASKDRTGLFIDRDPFLVTVKTGEELLNWNMKGAKTVQGPTASEKRLTDKKTMIVKLINSIAIAGGADPAAKRPGEEYAALVRSLTELDLIDSNYDEIISKLKVRYDELVETGTLSKDGKLLKPVQKVADNSANLPAGTVKTA